MSKTLRLRIYRRCYRDPRHSPLWALLWILLCQSPGAGARSQDPAPPSPVPAALSTPVYSGPAQPSAPLYSARSTLVLVPALVTTKTGELVFTLKADDFTITDDGVEQKAALEEETGGEPLALVVAIETGGAGGRRLTDYGSLGSMIEAVVGNVEHQVAVVRFDSSPEVVQGFTPDMDAVRAAIHGLTPGNGGAAILDGLSLSVDMLREQPPGYRRAILLISETLDRGSTVKLDDALRAVSDTNTAIYSVAFSTSKADMKREGAAMFGSVAGLTPAAPPGPPGGCMSKVPSATPDPDEKDPSENDPDEKETVGKSTAGKRSAGQMLAQAWDCLSLLAPPLRLAKMAALLGRNGLEHNVPETVANLTGGEYFSFNNAHSLERGLATISNHVPNRYVLSFQPQSPHPGLHAVQVRLKDYPGLTVTGRSSYWADSGAPAHP